MNAPIIRLIQKADNPHIARIIRSVLEDFNVPKVGTAYADAALDCMFETYQSPRAAYFVLEENGSIIGGGGIAQLANYEGNVCELQKMYLQDCGSNKDKLHLLPRILSLSELIKKYILLQIE